MSKRVVLKVLPVMILVFSLGIGADAFAWRGMGEGKGGGRGCGYAKGFGQGGYGCPGQYGLSEDETAKLQEERKAFFDATSELRRQAYEKELDLKKELAGENADMEKVSAIQKEISNLRAQLSQQWIEHLFKIRQINPNLGRGYMGRGSGYGCGGGNCNRGGGARGCPYGGGWGN